MADFAKLEEIQATLKAAVDRKRFNKIDFFQPSPKQAAFFAATKKKRQIMLRAGNQLGKSEAGAFLMAAAMTGRYPSWWRGRRWKKPIRAWLAGIKGTDVRDIQQTKLCGPPGVDQLLGSGYIPREAFPEPPSKKRGYDPPLFDTIYCKTLINGRLDDSAISTIKIKTYEEGRAGFQGEPVDLIWLDEEDKPTITGDSMSIFNECLARTTTTDGLVFVTFTPLNGRTRLVDHFEDDGEFKQLVTMSIHEATHLSDERKRVIMGQYPAHEQDARLYGIPLLGSGAIFKFDDEMILHPPLQNIPLDWRKLWGIDFGEGDHPFAAALGAIDDETDTIYLLHSIKMRGATKMGHIPAIRSIAAGVPVAWPHDMAKLREAGDGDLQQLAKQYANPSPGMQGLQMLGTHSTWPDGSNSTQAAIDELLVRSETNRFKVIQSGANEQFMDEKRTYHRKEGKIVKLNDDLLSAVFKIFMMQRYARAVPLGSRTAHVPRRTEARNVDFDLFS